MARPGRSAVRLALLLGAAAAAGAAATAWALRDADGDEGGDARAPVAVSAASGLELVERVRLEARRRLRPLDRESLRRRLRAGLNAEVGRRTPVATGAEPVEASSHPATELGDAAAPGFALERNTLVNRGRAYYIAEPDLAVKGERALVTWNVGAAFTRDGGRTFTFVDPASAFPAAHRGFCCDQLAFYSREHDLWVWLLQYYHDLDGNVLRLAVARGDLGFDTRSFAVFDLAPRAFRPGDAFPGLYHWFDYPGIAATAEHLFVSTNVFSLLDSYTGTVVARIPLAGLAAGRTDGMRYIRNRLGAATFAPGAARRMYFAQHLDTSVLRIWTWADDRPSPVPRDVRHSRYPYDPSGTFTCRREGVQGGDWCERETGGRSGNDDRATTGWVADGAIGFGWNAQQDPARGFPYPFVMVVRVDERTLELRDEPFLWHPEHAYQYLALAPGRGSAGGVVLAGGGKRYQTCAAVIRDARAEASGNGWDVRAVDASDSDPAEDQAGDYLGAAALRPDATAWAGSCMTLHGGGAEANVGIRYVRFGRPGP